MDLTHSRWLAYTLTGALFLGGPLAGAWMALRSLEHRRQRAWQDRYEDAQRSYGLAP